jgi:hypothetical protein
MKSGKSGKSGNCFRTSPEREVRKSGNSMLPDFPDIPKNEPLATDLASSFCVFTGSDGGLSFCDKSFPCLSLFFSRPPSLRLPISSKSALFSSAQSISQAALGSPLSPREARRGYEPTGSVGSRHKRFWSDWRATVGAETPVCWAMVSAVVCKVSF